MIELRQLSKTYQLNHRTFQALKNINLTIGRGEIFGIFGESGAGKSTLLRSINLLEKPSSGEVYVAGVNLTALSPHQLKVQRRNIGMIFQHFNLLQSRTVYENIALPLELSGQSKKCMQQAVMALIDLVHLNEHKNHYPNQLSGGQKQRVAIARALATKPHLLLCDEATSALDPKSTSSVLNLLQEVNRTLQVTIVLITHEMDVIKKICDRACFLNQGELIECGSVVQLFAKPKSTLTKQLVQKALHIELPLAMQNKLQKEPDPTKSYLVKFTFVGDDSKQPLMTTLIRQFNITINIIQANIENIQNTTVGFTVCELSGDHHDIDQALASITPSSIVAEVLGYV